MKQAILISTLILFLGCNSRKNIIVSKSDFYQAKVAFAELKETLKGDNAKLWAYKLNGPILLINRNTRTIIANENDKAGKFSKKGNLFIGKLPLNINIANTATEWNGKKWTMVALPLPNTKAKRLNLLIHESFHRIQPLIGFDNIEEIQSVHLDKKDGRIFIKLELEALKKALSSKEPKKHIKNALIFRQYRHQLYPKAKNAENSLEINEGLAEYTGSILSSRTENEMKKHYASKINWFYEMPSFVRSFAYFTIPVYGYFMEQTNSKWNLKINNKTNLTDFILHFYNIKKIKVDKKEMRKMAGIYKIDSIIEVENKREKKRLEKINKYKTKFLSNNVFSIKLKKMSIGFNPSNILPLDTLGTLYPNLRITDNWGILKVDSCGALLSPNYNKVTISKPTSITDTLILGKGWRIKLHNDWEFSKKHKKYGLIRKKLN